MNQLQPSRQDQCSTQRPSLSRSPLQERPGDGRSNCYAEARCPLKSPISSTGPTVDVENKYRYEQSSQELCSGLSRGGGPGLVDEVPPQGHWEIPRTPISKPSHSTAQYKQVQLPPGQCNRTGTPVCFKPPAHPLSHSNRATQRTTGSPGRRQATVTTACLNSSEHPTTSPSISVANDVHPVPDIECTENDLAFLKHMKNVKALAKLRAQADDLMRDKQKASEEKELLEHKAKKIDSDLQEMKNKLLEVTTAVQTLVPGEAVAGKECPESPFPNQSQLTQLKRLNRLTAVEVEKAAREASEKLDQINRVRLQLSGEIRTLEDTCAIENALLEASLRSTQDELVKAVERNNGVTAQHEAAKHELELLQTQLANCKLAEAHPAEDVDQKEEKRRKEKQQVEQKLVTIIRRCELYVERDKKLKELGL